MLSACEQRAMVRRATSWVMTPSSLSHSTSCCQCSGPRGSVRAEILGFACAVIQPPPSRLKEAEAPLGGSDDTECGAWGRMPLW